MAIPVAAGAVVTAKVVLILTQAGFLADAGADQHIARAIERRAQAVLIEASADAVGQVVSGCTAFQPAPAAVATVIARRRGVGAAVEGRGRFGRRRRQWQRFGLVGILALAGSQQWQDEYGYGGAHGRLRGRARHPRWLQATPGCPLRPMGSAGPADPV